MSERLAEKNSWCRCPGVLCYRHQLRGLAGAAGRIGITPNDYELHSRESYPTRFARCRFIYSKQFNQQTTSPMKKLVSFVLYSTAAALCLGAVSASAGFVTPRVPPGTAKAAAWLSADQPFTPNGLPTVRTVTNNKDTGPGSLRRAIASAGAGDSIKFALTLPATISLSSTLVITQDVVVLGPGPDRLAVSGGVRLRCKAGVGGINTMGSVSFGVRKSLWLRLL